MQHINTGSLRALRSTCVIIPLLLALASIASTSLPPHLQNQPILGVPVILWCWLSVSASIVAITIISMSRLNFDELPDTSANGSSTTAHKIAHVTTSTNGNQPAEVTHD